MTDSKLLTPEYIQQIIDETEIPLRCRTYPHDTVNEVFRYGAFVGSTIEHHVQIPRAMDRARELIRNAEEKNQSFHSGIVILADEMKHTMTV